REVADVPSREPSDRVEAREGKPFGVDMHLHLVPARDDRADDRVDHFGAVDQCRHRIDEEYPRQAVAFEHVHLEMDTEVAVAAAAEDRGFEIGTRIETPLIEAGR